MRHSRQASRTRSIRLSWPQANCRTDDRRLFQIDEIPYDFLRRRLTIVVAENDVPSQHLIVTKGAFANVLDVCSSQDRDGVEVPLDAQRRAELEEVFKAKGAEGFRVLAVATRKVGAKVHFSRDDEQYMTFRGFLVFLDPPKADARRTIHDLNNSAFA